MNFLNFLRYILNLQKGETALLIAVRNSNESIVEALLVNCADVNACDNVREACFDFDDARLKFFFIAISLVTLR